MRLKKKVNMKNYLSVRSYVHKVIFMYSFCGLRMALITGIIGFIPQKYKKSNLDIYFA